VSLAPAADQTLAILTLLSRQPEPLPAAAIAAAIGAPRSTTYRLLAVLVEHRFLSYLPEQRRYGLGVAAYELGSAYTRQMPLQRIARPLLARLVDQTRQNGHLATLDGRDVYYLIEERAAGRPSLVTEVGVRLPATLTASGLAMLAALPPAQLRAIFPPGAALTQREGRGPATVTELRRALAETRRRGHAVEEDLVTVGLSSVSRPVLDHTGHPVAAVALTFRSDQVEEPARLALVRAVGQAADALAHRLGAG
jgi:DNA-binding IclR family transcriptional regulator